MYDVVEIGGAGSTGLQVRGSNISDIPYHRLVGQRCL